MAVEKLWLGSGSSHTGVRTAAIDQTDPTTAGLGQPYGYPLLTAFGGIGGSNNKRLIYGISSWSGVVPSGGYIVGVVLRIRSLASGEVDARPYTINAHQILAAGYVPSQATWNKKNSTDNWATAGADGSGTDRSASPDGSGLCDSGLGSYPETFITGAGMLAAVRAAHAANSAIDFLLIRDDESNSPEDFAFFEWPAGDSYEAYWEITWVPKYTDFSEYTPDAHPSDWTRKTGTSIDADVVAYTGSLSGQALVLESADEWDQGEFWNPAAIAIADGGFDGRLEVLAVFRYLGLMAYGRGVGLITSMETESAPSSVNSALFSRYGSGFNDSGPDTEGLSLQRRPYYGGGGSPEPETVLDTFSLPANDTVVVQRICIDFDAGTIKAYRWTYGDAVKTAADTPDAELVGNPYYSTAAGVYRNGTSTANKLVVEYFSFGTNGDAAPMPSEGGEGLVAATLAALTSSAAGKVQIKAATTATLAAATLSATGVLPIEGTLGATLGAMTSVTNGELDIDGATAGQLADLTSASTGAIDISGALTKTLDPLTCASTGFSEGISGEVDATLDDLTCSSVGGIPVEPPVQTGGSSGGWGTKPRRRKPNFRSSLDWTPDPKPDPPKLPPIAGQVAVQLGEARLRATGKLVPPQTAAALAVKLGDVKSAIEAQVDWAPLNDEEQLVLLALMDFEIRRRR